MCDETYIHEAVNRTAAMRIILFCHIDQPLHKAVVRAFNRGFGFELGRATAVRNLEGEPFGVVNRLYFIAHPAGELRRRLKRANNTVYLLLTLVLAASVITC